MSPLVSVLLPVYNAALTLPRALNSLLGQSLSDFEVIAVDDGSDDASPCILEDLAQKDRRIRPVLAEHQGLIAALNVGLDCAHGTYIARMDADDVSHPTRLQKQAALLSRNRDLSVASCLVRSFPKSDTREGFRVYEAWLNSLISHADIARDIFIESPLSHPSVMMRADELRGLGGYEDRSWPEDYDLWLRYYLAGKRFAKVPEVLYLWRERVDRLSRQDGRYSVENFLRAKAFYLLAGPLRHRDGVVILGAGRIGRRISKHLLRGGAKLVAFLDVDTKKIGTGLSGVPILSPDRLPDIRKKYARSMALSAVSSHGARSHIREWLSDTGLEEGRDFLCIA